MFRRIIALCVLTFCLLIPAWAHSTATKNATAVSLLRTAVSALASGTNISSVTLTASVTRTAGSDVETGSATLEALGGVDSSINLELSNGQRTQIINQSGGVPAGQWSGANGTIHAVALHNCWAPADWFFPALALAEALNNPSIEIAYVGQATHKGMAVQHVRFWHALSSGGTPGALKLIGRLSTVDVYLNATNGLPVALDFNLHPHKNAAADIPVEIRYSNYQQLNGILQPVHIEKLLNHSLFLDLQVTGATVNPSLSSTDFTVTTASQ